ncbi:uncharacterized protein LOC106463427 isoform X1 [Limulus polyphemus]|uniref:Uncharacterized protein LOC106463427 isoform X1 n=1 Tax=Limulus polyphemus TaxID=6850 RepID=A0ABM1SSL3_LIMPO|nr:uncharacterized protein LOC106463427 isoform X1 [Limulus polyphemus]XP_022246621.1 uncharacterized protein LOC106463427 isoform X1 [Limulus polyphemus]
MDELHRAQKAKEEIGKPSVFSKIIKKELPADILFEDDQCIAFHDINPQAPSHFLVVSKKPIPMLDDVQEEDTKVLDFRSHVDNCKEFSSSRKIGKWLQNSDQQWGTRLPVSIPSSHSCSWWTTDGMATRLIRSVTFVFALLSQISVTVR